MTYHIGLSKQGKTLIIEAVRCIDYLGCEIYDYMGERETTKKHLKAHRYEFLAWLKNWKPDVYGNLRYAVIS